jgi:hypothetical protein
LAPAGGSAAAEVDALPCASALELAAMMPTPQPWCP